MSCVMIPSVLPRSPVVRAALENGLPLPCAEHQGVAWGGWGCVSWRVFPQLRLFFVFLYWWLFL